MAIDHIENLDEGSLVRSKLNAAIDIVNTNENAQVTITGHMVDTNNPHDTSWNNLLDVPADFPPEVHTHTETSITDLDRIRWAGVWAAGTYYLNDVVKQDTYTCVCIVPSTTDKPVDPTLSPDWEILAKEETSGTSFVPDAFTGAGTSGYVPDSVVEVGNFLRDDGTWVPVATTPAYTDLTGEAASIPFTPQAAPTHNEGELWYDSSAFALSYYNDEVDVTVNLGQEVVIRVRNNTGVTITNGQVVYLSGSQGANLPTVALAQADALATSRVLGIATHDIENNTNGYITTLGEVKDLNTAAFAAGAALYLDTAVAGGLTTTRPTTGYAVVVGYCVISHVSIGEIKVLPGVTVQRADLWDGSDFTGTDITNWNTAFSWGDHASTYVPLSGGVMTGSLEIDGTGAAAQTGKIVLRDGTNSRVALWDDLASQRWFIQNNIASGDLQFERNGTIRMTLEDAGPLVVEGTAYSGQVKIIDDTGPTLSLWDNIATNRWAIQMDLLTNFLLFKHNGTTLFQIENGGNVRVNDNQRIQLGNDGKAYMDYQSGTNNWRMLTTIGSNTTVGIGTNGTTAFWVDTDQTVAGLFNVNTTHNANGKFVVMTAAQYAALGTPDANTIYFVTA